MIEGMARLHTNRHLDRELPRLRDASACEYDVAFIGVGRVADQGDNVLPVYADSGSGRSEAEPGVVKSQRRRVDALSVLYQSWLIA